MPDINISQFTDAIKNFLTKYDKNNDGSINKDNSELADLLAGLDNSAELSPTDKVEIHNAINAASELHQRAKAFNDMKYEDRKKLVDDIVAKTEDKFNETFENVSKKIKEFNPEIKIPGQIIGAGREGTLKQYIKDVIGNLETGLDEYNRIRKDVQKLIREYDSRYATDPDKLGVTRFDTDDTRTVTVDAQWPHMVVPDVNELLNMNDTEVERILSAFENYCKTYVQNKVRDLITAIENINTEIKENRKVTIDDMNKVAEDGSLTNEVVSTFTPSGLHLADKFNVSDNDPETYYAFVGALSDISVADAIVSPKAEAPKQDGIYDMQGHKVGENQMQPGNIYIINGKKVLFK